MRSRQRLDRLHAHPAFPAALAIVERLAAHGFEAVFAGGCVRDGLLGRESKDMDIATSALPEDVERLFERTLAVGREFGTMVVVTESAHFEVTTFRSDGPYENGRHPTRVEFRGMQEDAFRRDFTVNALFYDPKSEEVIDFVAGQADLNDRCLRTVGDPKQRFAEDRLRMLRAVRFAAQLGFRIDAATAAAIQSLRSDLKAVSVERILNEVKRLLGSTQRLNGLEYLRLTQLYESFWPEFARVELSKLQAFPEFHDWLNAFCAIEILAEAEPEPRLKVWKASRETLRAADEQVGAARTLLGESTRAARARALGGDTFASVLVLTTGLFKLAKRSSQLDAWIQEFLEVATPEGRLPKPLVGGEDLIRIGVSPGTQMGDLLRQIYDEQLEGRVRSRSEALARASALKV